MSQLDQFNSMTERAAALIGEHRLAEAYDLLYEAETVAYNSGMYSAAADCRKAIVSISKGIIPAWLSFDGDGSRSDGQRGS